MTWEEIKELFDEFGWEVTSDFAFEYQENPWTKRLLDAAKDTVDDRNEIEATIEAIKEDREEAVSEAEALADAAEKAERLQALVDEISHQPVMHITVSGGSKKMGVILTPDQIKELSALASFPPFVAPPTISVDGKPLASGGVVPSPSRVMKTWGEAMRESTPVWPEDESS
jgi:hypothetical protein